LQNLGFTIEQMITLVRYKESKQYIEAIKKHRDEHKEQSFTPYQYCQMFDLMLKARSVINTINANANIDILDLGNIDFNVLRIALETFGSKLQSIGFQIGEFFAAITQCTSLKTLNLSRSVINEQAAAALARIIEQSAGTMKILNFNHTTFENSSPQTLAPAIEKCTILS